LKGNIEERACMLAQYIIENRTTVRAAAKKFGISKSTVHKGAPNRNGSQRAQPFGEAGHLLPRRLSGPFRRGGAL